MFGKETSVDVEIEIVDKEPDLLSFGSWMRLDNLSEEDRQKIADNAYKELLKIYQERKELEEDIKSYRNQYYGNVQEKDIPYADCFNLNVPITPKIVDAAEAQCEEAFEEIDPKWQVGPSARGDLVPLRDQQEKVLDYYEDTEMHDSVAWGQAYHDAFLLGNGWLGMPYKREFERVKEYRKYESIDSFMADFPDDYEKYPKILGMLNEGKVVKCIIDKNQEICRSPVPEKYEWEDIFVPLKTKLEINHGFSGIHKSRIVGRRIWKKWSEIYEQEEKEGKKGVVSGDFFPGTADKIKYKVESTKDGSKANIDPEYTTKEYETFELIYFASIGKNPIPVRLLINIILPQSYLSDGEPTARVVPARIIRYPYFHNRSYILPVVIKTDKSGIYQDGFGAMLQDIHIAANATLNHVLDASVIANSLSLKAREGSSGAARVYEHKWYPGSVLELANMDDVQQFTFNTPNLSSLIQLFVIIERFAGDATGVINYILGQEAAEDPNAPGVKQRALTRKAELKLRKYIKNIRRSINEMGYQALRLIYQFTPSEALTEIIGEQVNESKDFMKPALRTVTQATAFDLDTMMMKQDSMGFLQLLMKLEPMFVQNPVARMHAWRILARNWGSNWNQWINLLLDSPEKVQAQIDKAQADAQQKRLGVGINAAMTVKQQGGSDDDARAAGLRALEVYDAMQSEAQQEQAKEQKGAAK